jgi:hypothetical protein
MSQTVANICSSFSRGFAIHGKTNNITNIIFQNKNSCSFFFSFFLGLFSIVTKQVYLLLQMFQQNLMMPLIHANDVMSAR